MQNGKTKCGTDAEKYRDFFLCAFALLFSLFPLFESQKQASFSYICKPKLQTFSSFVLITYLIDMTVSVIMGDMVLTVDETKKIVHFDGNRLNF